MKTIFFDLDDTLYFRQDAYFSAFEEYFNNDDAALKKKAADRCRIRGDEVFYQAQRGEITMDQMYIYRFQKGLEDCNIHITPEQALEFKTVYKEHLYSLKLKPQVIRILDCAKKYFDRIGIITNGPIDHQWNKIKKLGLEKWLTPELVIVSGEHKVDKPDPKIFEIAMTRAGKTPDQIILVGDSYQNDMIPASRQGWHTVWLNLYDEDLKAPEFEIKAIEELENLMSLLS